MSAPTRTAALAALALLSAAAFALLAWYFGVGEGRLDFSHHARGRDFVNLWTAGRLIGEGRAVEVFEPRAFMAAHHRLFSPALPFHFWSYPPPALLLAAPFALAPGYFAALAAWTAAGLVLLFPAARAALGLPPGRRSRVEAALLMLSPAVAVNVGLGQNGALTAALLLGGLALAEARPLAGGALLGLLVFKPQVALLLPVVVLAGRRWRMMTGAVASAVLVVALATAVFGLDSWRAFLDGSAPMQSQMLREGRGPFIGMMTSAFMAGRLLHWPWTTALLAQAPFTALGVWLVWRAWRDGAGSAVERAALLCAATFLATPQAFNYDLIPAAFAALVLLRPGERPRGGWVWTLDALIVLAAWALPAAMLWVGVEWHVPVAPAVLTLLTLRLAWRMGLRPYPLPPIPAEAGTSRSSYAYVHQSRRPRT